MRHHVKTELDTLALKEILDIRLRARLRLSFVGNVRPVAPVGRVLTLLVLGALAIGLDAFALRLHQGV